MKDQAAIAGASAVMIAVSVAGCVAHWQGVRVTALRRAGDRGVGVQGAQVRLLDPSAGVCSVPTRVDSAHWFEGWGLRTDGDGNARFQLWKCERVRVVVSKLQDREFFAAIQL